MCISCIEMIDAEKRYEISFRRSYHSRDWAVFFKAKFVSYYFKKKKRKKSNDKCVLWISVAIIEIALEIEEEGEGQWSQKKTHTIFHMLNNSTNFILTRLAVFSSFVRQLTCLSCAIFDEKNRNWFVYSPQTTPNHLKLVMMPFLSTNDVNTFEPFYPTISDTKRNSQKTLGYH